MRPESFSLNPYEVLGVSPNASNEEIQAAYRQHALRWHPDRNPNDDYAMRMMQRVNGAWTILKDEQSRAAYDRWQAGERNTGSGPDAWEQPPSGPPPGGEWYRPPPPDDYAAHYNATNDSKTGLPADFFQRLFAYLIDYVFIFALSMAVTIGLLNWFDLSDEPVIAGPFGWIFLAMPVLYFTALVAGWSTTLGKMIFKLRVVRNDGSKIGIGRAFARYLCYIFSSVLFVGFLMILLRPDKRGLHDLICDTKVVYR